MGSASELSTCLLHEQRPRRRERSAHEKILGINGTVHKEFRNLQNGSATPPQCDRWLSYRFLERKLGIARDIYSLSHQQRQDDQCDAQYVGTLSLYGNLCLAKSEITHSYNNPEGTRSLEQKAEQYYSEALELKPNNARVLDRLARLKLVQASRQYDLTCAEPFLTEAERLLATAMTLPGHYPSLFCTAADFYLSLRHIEPRHADLRLRDAKDAFRRALASSHEDNKSGQTRRRIQQICQRHFDCDALPDSLGNVGAGLYGRAEAAPIACAG